MGIPVTTSEGLPDDTFLVRSGGKLYRFTVGTRAVIERQLPRRKIDLGPCVGGHRWKQVGGRRCACTDTHNRSQPVFQCLDCEEWDYGDPGGPGHAACKETCGCP